MRIANWNLERASSAWRRDAIMKKIACVDADIWILTETRDSLTPGATHSCVASSRSRALGERWISIWSRYPGVQRPTSDDEYAACAILDVGARGQIALYGMVLPWAGSTWGGHPSANATAYRGAVDAQSGDWIALGKAFTDVCVAGDFNQDLSTKHYYWSAEARRVLRAALTKSNLEAMTGGEDDPVRRITDGAAACIDHVCLSSSLASRSSGGAQAWSGTIDTRRVSDHPGIYVDLTL